MTEQQASMEFDIMQFIRPELLILIPFLWGIGFFLKRHPNFESWRIPFVLCGVGLVFAPLYMFAVTGAEDVLATMVTGIIQGVLVACVAVGSYEGYKQMKGKGGNND